MPTYKEVSKIKTDFVDKKKSTITDLLQKQQLSLFDNLLNDFIKTANDKISGKQVSTNKIQQQLKRFYKENAIDVLKQTIDASKSVTDLNQMYFATLLDSNKLDDIHTKTKSLVNKRLGLDENGKLKPGGFTDKALNSEALQKQFIRKVNKILSGNPDIVSMQNQLKQFIVGKGDNIGLLESNYRTISSDVIRGIDRSNSLVYANELELQSFVYSGGLLTTSRTFCQTKNGKIFSRTEASKWKDSAFITDMYGKNIDDYEALIDMGGYGCQHTPDWISQELANAIKPTQNARAKERNANFVDKNINT